MARLPLPTAFALLKDERNAAADAALVEVLPHLDPTARTAALDLLLKRRDDPSLTVMVGRFSTFDETLQDAIVTRAEGLTEVVRDAMKSPSVAERLGAIHLIKRASLCASAYLLTDALRSRCNQTREAAAVALHAMTDAWLKRRAKDGLLGSADELERQAMALTAALAAGVDRWEAHFQPKVIQAALWMGGRIEPAVRDKLAAPRSKLAQILRHVFSGTSDPRLAEFLFHALTLPEVRVDAARAIARPHEPPFLTALLTHARLLDVAAIAEGSRWVREVEWFPRAAACVLALPPDALPGALRFLGTIGGDKFAKAAAFRELIGASREDVRRAVVEYLRGDPSCDSTDLLAIIAIRSNDDWAKPAADELRRRLPAAAADLHTTAGGAIDPDTRRAFTEFWDRFDALDAVDRATVAEVLRGRISQVALLVRARLASSEPFERARALRVAAELGPSEEWHDGVERLAHDPDAIVRALAVAQLDRYADAASKRILRTAINDPDERVQANAIEALDRLGVPERVAALQPKLQSPNSRVRATAVQSLLRAEVRQAGETLLDMLEDPSAAHRLSALWVVERLGLRAVRDRILALSRSDPDERVRRRAKRLLASTEASIPSTAGAAEAATATATPGATQ